ncbi:unnamed protein product [Euphydryas editha]|uniref:Endonuclease-reverse transcriptase n=1 Tax=Euphydryas editha TaxID=104508 RepID=A0AAU9TKM9_EUPED|nr:unnamed protein product [Euphydryas editha]
MEEIKEMLRMMQEEVIQQRVDMLAMKEDIKSTINNNINEKFKNLEIKNEQLEQKLDLQKLKIDNFEKTLRRKNLLFFGVEEREKNYQELEKKVLDIINNILNIKCEKHYIESVRRLGIKTDKVRPIVITLLTMGMKIQILKNKKKLENSSYYIKEDYPLEVLNKRKELQREVAMLREQGKKAIIKYDKIVILKNSNQQELKKIQNKKRNLSESPEMTTCSTAENKKTQKQPTKINKFNNNMNSYILKKPTLTLYDNTPSKTCSSERNTE